MKKSPFVMLLTLILMTQPISQASTDKLLPRCPNSPNCVSSQADSSDKEHFIAPLKIIGEPALAWSELQKALVAQSRTHITKLDNYALQAEATSLIFRFVDDIEAILEPSSGLIHIRSASRVGYGDLGVNRKRVEQLRQDLQKAGVVE